MIYHDTKYNPLSPSDTGGIPMASMQIASCQCFHCGRETRFPVKAEFTDWKIIAEEYQRQTNRIITRFNRIVSDIDAMQPEDNPVRAYLSNEWAIVVMDIRKHFKQ